MSDPTPVMSSTKQIDSGSMRKFAFAWKPETGAQVNRWLST